MRWIVYILLLLTIGCTSTKKADNQSFTPHYAPKYSQSFSIVTDSAGRKILIISNPYQSDKPFEQRVYLLEDGQSAPKGEVAVNIPAQRISCLSSSHIAMLDAVGAADRVVGVSGLKFISNSTVRSRAVEIGYDAALNFENIKGAGTDVILLYGLYGEQSSMTTKLTQLGIPYIYI